MRVFVDTDCAVLRRTAGDAQDHLAGIDSELPGFTFC